MLNNNSNFAKELFEGLNNKEQEEILNQMLNKQHNIINDFRKTNADTVEEIDYSNDNNIVEPIADLIFKVIVSIFPKFKKGN